MRPGETWASAANRLLKNPDFNKRLTEYARHDTEQTLKLAKMMGQKPRPNANRLLREMVEILRKENLELETKVRAMERHMLKHSVRSHAAEDALLAAAEAVRVLAKQVDSETTIGKKARAEARAILEKAGLKPPGTLGSSRERKRRSRKQKPPAKTPPSTPGLDSGSTA